MRGYNDHVTTIVMLVLAGAFVLTILAYLTVESDWRDDGRGPAASASASHMLARVGSTVRGRIRWR